MHHGTTDPLGLELADLTSDLTNDAYLPCTWLCLMIPSREHLIIPCGHPSLITCGIRGRNTDRSTLDSCAYSTHHDLEVDCDVLLCRRSIRQICSHSKSVQILV